MIFKSMDFYIVSAVQKVGLRRGAIAIPRQLLSICNQLKIKISFSDQAEFLLLFVKE